MKLFNCCEYSILKRQIAQLSMKVKFGEQETRFRVYAGGSKLLVKGQVIIIFCLAGHIISVAVLDLAIDSSAQEAINGMCTNGCSCVPIKLYL